MSGCLASRYWVLPGGGGCNTGAGAGERKGAGVEAGAGACTPPHQGAPQLCPVRPGAEPLDVPRGRHRQLLRGGGRRQGGGLRGLPERGGTRSMLVHGRLLLEYGPILLMLGSIFKLP